MNWKPIATAPKDGTEILARDEDGISIIAWCEDPDTLATHGQEGEPGWYLRSGGDWELFDGFALQPVYPKEWIEIPD